MNNFKEAKRILIFSGKPAELIAYLAWLGPDRFKKRKEELQYARKNS